MPICLSLSVLLCYLPFTNHHRSQSYVLCIMNHRHCDSQPSMFIAGDSLHATRILSKGHRNPVLIAAFPESTGTRLRVLGTRRSRHVLDINWQQHVRWTGPYGGVRPCLTTPFLLPFLLTMTRKWLHISLLATAWLPQDTDLHVPRYKVPTTMTNSAVFSLAHSEEAMESLRLRRLEEAGTLAVQSSSLVPC